MVFFTCNGCGESLKKAQVEKHRYKCRNSYSLTCIDCLKDFHDQDYAEHLKCVSEDQKYGGANYVPKENKGEVKQEKWIEKVQQAIKDASNLQNRRLAELLERIKNFPNVPRKEAKFKNFLQNSLREKNFNLISEAWNAIAAKTSAEQKETQHEQKHKDEKTDSPMENGQENVKSETDQSESTKKKRKNKDGQSESATSKSKKSKNSDSSTENANPAPELPADQSENDKKDCHAPENQIDQSATTNGCAENVDQSESSTKKREKRTSQSESAPPKSKKVRKSHSSTDNSDPAPASSIDQSENDAKVDQASENQADQSETSTKKRTSQSESSPNKHKESNQSDSSVENVDPAADLQIGAKNDPASENQMDQSVKSEGGVESIDNQSNEKGGKKLKSVIKKLLTEADEQKMPLKRLKKLAAKNLALTETPKKMKIYEEIDSFLRKHAKKYVVDGKMVKFAQEN